MCVCSYSLELKVGPPQPPLLLRPCSNRHNNDLLSVRNVFVLEKEGPNLDVSIKMWEFRWGRYHHFRGKSCSGIVWPGSELQLE